MRNRKDNLFGTDVGTVPQFNARYPPFGENDLFDAGFESDLSPAFGQKILDLRAVQLLEGRRGDQHLPAVARSEETIHKNLTGMREADPFQALAEGADQDHIPETIDDGLRLPLLFEPFRHGWLMLRIDGSSRQLFQSPRQLPFLMQVEIRQPRERREQMQGCRQKPAGGKAVDLKSGASLIRTDKIELLRLLEGVCDPDRFTESIKFMAAAHADMLAIVNQG